MTQPSTTLFGKTTTADEVLAGVNLTRRRILVTGGASGIGLETARSLARAGAEVTIAARNVEAGEAAAADIRSDTGNAAVLVRGLDLADQRSVRAFVRGWEGPLDVLVANAGVMATPEIRTPEGWELQFATNHLGHFALALGLHDSLAAAQGSRIVVVSSVGHVNADVDFDDLHFERRPYDAFTAYGQSKTANVLFAVEAARKWAPDQISVNALNPGRITSTNLSRYIGSSCGTPASFQPNSTDVSYKDAKQGAATSALLAGSPLVDGVTGAYFEDCQQAMPYVEGIRRGVASWALDPDHAQRLWRVSFELLKHAL
jgi:NAD(P)-dependent dehydrogenase (short-subunit alcohol dehydrogenase family)